MLSFECDTVSDLVMMSQAELKVRGITRAPARNAPHGVVRVVELTTFQARLRRPRERLLTCGPNYSSGEAAARFLFFLTGSDRAEDIAPFAGRIGQFSPDGIALGGSAHGPRVFSRICGQSLYDRCVASLLDDGESCRALLPVYWPADIGTGYTDAPCIASMLAYHRNGKVFASVHMRSQEAMRLLAYDVFELTLFHELISCVVNMELGEYTHSAFALQSVIRNETSAHRVASQDVRTSLRPPTMMPMPAHTELAALRRDANTWLKVAASANIVALRALSRDLPAYWFDFVCAATIRASALRKDPNARAVSEACLTLANDCNALTQLESDAMVRGVSR